MPFDGSLQYATVIERFTKKQMTRLRSSNGKRKGEKIKSYIRPKDEALTYPWVQFNGTRWRKYFGFDIDKRDAAFAWQDANVPRPTIMIRNPENGHAHYLYELTDPYVYKDENGCKLANRQTRFADQIMRSMQRALGADLSYVGVMCKNPLHAMWRTECYDNTYSFAELAEHLDLDWQDQDRVQQRADRIAKTEHPTSRNIKFKHTYKYWAYDNARHYPSFEAYHKAGLEHGHRLNHELFADDPLDDSEIHDWVIGANRWTWGQLQIGNFTTGYSPSSARKRVMNLSADMSINERLVAGQQYMCDQRMAKTRDKIMCAIGQLQQQGQTVNISSVARLTKMDRKTIRNHWQYVNQHLADSDGTVFVVAMDSPVTTPLVMPEVTPLVIPTFSLVTGTYTVETETLRVESLVKAATAAGVGLIQEGKLPTPTAAEKPEECTIIDRNNEPWKMPFEMWGEGKPKPNKIETIQSKTEIIDEISRLEFLLPDIASSAELKSFKDYQQEYLDSHSGKQVPAFLYARDRAFEAAIRFRYPIDGIPSQIRLRVQKLMEHGRCTA